MSIENQFSANPKGIRSALQDKKIFIAGCGGLGSNVAMLLVRAGAGNLTLCDFDHVSESNLNRQFFFQDQIGLAKVDALAENLKRINPHLKLKLQNQKMDFEENLSRYDVVIECFDKANYKAQLVSTMLKNHSQTPIISCSGLAGKEPIDQLKINYPHQKLVLIGDQKLSPEEGDGTLSSRVMAAAALQAHEVIRILSQ